jgi:translocation and assembly module TamB
LQSNGTTTNTSTNVDLLITRNADSLAFGHATVPVNLTFEHGAQMADSLPMFGTFTFHNLDLAELNPLLPYGSTMGGNIDGDFMILGSPAIPNWTGELRLTDANYRDRRYGVNYQHTNLVLEVDRDTLRVKRLEMESDGKVSGTGVAIMAFPKPEYLDLDLKFEKFQAVNSRRIQARLSGNVKVKGPLDSLDARGDLTFTESLYRITQSSTKQIEQVDIAAEVAHLRGDTTAVGPSLVDRIYGPMSHTIRVEVPGNMWLRGGGVNVELAGKLWLYKQPHGDPYINGDILVRKGTVEVWGHEFRVPEDSGRVSFKGAVDNPELDIRAYYTSRDNELLSVKLSGTLAETRTELSGQSAQGDSMSAEQVVVALFGSFVPSTDGSGGGAEEQIAAAGISQLSSALGKMAGLDVVRYEASDKGDLTQGKLEVGSYVTDRLFVRVKQPVESVQLGQDVLVEYRLIDWLKLSAQRSGEAFDLKTVFQIEWR